MTKKNVPVAKSSEVKMAKDICFSFAFYSQRDFSTQSRVPNSSILDIAMFVISDFG